MKSPIWALLVHDQDDPVGKLQPVLANLSVPTLRVRTCEATAWLVLGHSEPPHLVFTESILPDGNWQKVLDLTARAQAAVNVLVVAPEGNAGLEVEVIVRGAFDLITPPFVPSNLARAATCAMNNVFSRRRDQHSHRFQQSPQPMRRF